MPKFWKDLNTIDLDFSIRVASLIEEKKISFSVSGWNAHV
ncbi:UNVERIFIED_ORG: hypothetical protein ABRZ91_002620 [Heyndrickxia coagulans]|jgi:hypothetical protein